MKQRRKAVEPEIVRRPKAERKRLPPHLEAFAQSDETKLRRPPSAPRRETFPPRAGRLVPGVINPDARVVYDARVAALRSALSSKNDELAERLLAQTVLLALWRAKNIMGFDAFVEDVLGLRSADARERAKRGAERLSVATLAPLDDETVAAWMRAEAALAGDVPGATVDIETTGDAVLVLRLPVARAIGAFAALGTRAPGGFAKSGGRDDEGDSRESRDSRDSRGPRSFPSRDGGDSRGPRSFSSRDGGDSRGPRSFSSRDSRDSRGPRAPSPRDSRDSRDSRGPRASSPRDASDDRRPRDASAPRGPRGPRR